MANKLDIIDSIANKYHVPKSQVECAIKAQFKYVAQFMGRDSMPTVRLPYFGKLIVNKKILNHINKANAKRIKIDQQSSQQSEKET